MKLKFFTKTLLITGIIFIYPIVNNVYAQINMGGFYTIDRDQTFPLDINLTSDLFFTFTGNYTLTIDGAIKGNYGIGVINAYHPITNPNGSGTLILNANNTYSGPTIVGSTTGRGYVVLGINGKISNTSYIALTNSSTLSSSNLAFLSSTGTYNCPIFGTGSVTVAGSSIIRFNGNCSYTGGTFVGILSGGAELQIATPQFIGDITLSMNGKVHFINETWSSYNYNALVLGSGYVIKSGSGTTTLANTGNHSYNKTTTISQGTLRIEGFLANTTEVNIASGANIDFNVSTDKTYTCPFTGEGNVIKNASGIIKLFGINTYTGKTTIYSNELWINGNFASSEVFMPNYDAGFVFDNSSGGSYAYNGVFSGSGEIVKRGTSTLKLMASSPFSGRIRIHSTNSRLEIYEGITNVSDISIVSSVATIDFCNSNSQTYSCVISGDGNVSKHSTGSLIFTGENTYTGVTNVYDGILQIGDGTVAGSISSTSNVVLNNAASHLIFNRSDVVTFRKVISGSGKFTKKCSNTLVLTKNNTYTGVTTIEQGGLYLGDTGGSNEGEIVSASIVNNGTLAFRRSNNHTYSGVISGTGRVEKWGEGNTTLSGINTYTGSTTIVGGTLTLSSSGSIANSSFVAFTGTAPKLDISAGNKTIKSLGGSTTTASEIILGIRTLQIGTSAASTDGGGDFSGKFSGSGGVLKTGTEKLVLSGTINSASSTFQHQKGKIELSDNFVWAGNYTQEATTTLDINNKSFTVNGTASFNGGEIFMTTNSSAIISVGSFASCNENTIITLTPQAVNNRTLITAYSGLNANNFTAEMPGYDCTLTSPSGTQLVLNSQQGDNIAPVPGAGVTAGTATTTTIYLSWNAASDNLTPVSNLRYYVYQSINNNIATVSDCEANGTCINSGGNLNLTSFTATNLYPFTDYWFNVVVKDETGNKSAYNSCNSTTLKATLEGSVYIEGDAFVGRTLYAQTSDLTTQPYTPNIGTLSYQWKKNNIPVGENSPSYYLTSSDKGYTITVTVTASNCNGNITSAPTSIVIDPNGIEEISNQILIYPNPVTNTLQIANCSLKQNDKINIFSTTGKIEIIYEIISFDNEISIDVSSLSKGIYVIKIGNITKKFIKQ